VRLRHRFAFSASIDRLLAALAAFNGAAWIWIARSAEPTPYVQTQLLLSGVLYFRIGVWTSLAMVLLQRAASRS